MLNLRFWLPAYTVWFLCGYLLLVFGELPEWLSWANGVYLILAGCTALVWLCTVVGASSAARFALLCMLLSYGSELLGSATGLWFGSYSYSEAFRPLIAGVPLAIPFAWCLVLVIGWTFFPGRSIGNAAGAASIAVVLDLLLDPVSVQQGYWSWETATPLQLHGVPWTNFVSWWLTSFAIMLAGAPAGRSADGLRLAVVDRYTPWVLLGSLELLFLTLTIKLQLVWALALHLLLWVPLLLWSRTAKLKEVTR